MPYDRPPAPGDLARIENFCNSARFLSGEDALAGLDSARVWLRAYGYGKAARTLDEPARSGLVGAREAVRNLLGGDRSPATLRTLNGLARPSLAPSWTEDGVELAPPDDASPVPGVLAALAEAALTGTDQRLKVCAAPDCRWVFYDRSPANRGVWCSMDICGARHKMRAYRERQTPPANA